MRKQAEIIQSPQQRAWTRFDWHGNTCSTLKVSNRELTMKIGPKNGCATRRAARTRAPSARHRRHRTPRPPPQRLDIQTCRVSAVVKGLFARRASTGRQLIARRAQRARSGEELCPAEPRRRRNTAAPGSLRFVALMVLMRAKIERRRSRSWM